MTQKQLLLSNVLLLTALISFNTFCVGEEGDYGRSALHKATWTNDLQQARQILSRDEDPDKMDAGKNTPPHLAINGGHWDMVKLLLHSGADPDAPNIDGNTPLHSAARWNRYKIAKELLHAGANIQVKNVAGERPLDTAESVQSEEVEGLLVGAQHIAHPVFTSQSGRAIMMMIERAAMEEAVATQS